MQSAPFAHATLIQAPGRGGLTSASKRIDKMIAELGDWRGERLAEIRIFDERWLLEIEAIAAA
jgi:hypothetical protein